ncbi:MAG: hypothetical protein GY766_18450, partial [Herbaspirillum sp.]|uniref:hypothetical protein n=1 Tax=Herbaspirillum sp. TaxID=1890675 RepID=UPI00258A2339
DAGARGIDATSSTNCRVIDNDVHNATTEGITRDSSTGLVCGNNHGDASPLLSMGITDLTGYSHTGDTADTLMATITVPANTISQVKQGMRITASGSLSGGAGSAAAQLEIGAVDAITSPAFNAGKWRIEATVMNTAAAVQVSSTKSLSNNGVSSDVGLDNNGFTQDTTADFNVDIRLQLTNAGDTITLDVFTVEFIGLE